MGLQSVAVSWRRCAARTGGGVRIERVRAAAKAAEVQVARVAVAVAQRPPPPDALVPGRAYAHLVNSSQ